MSTVLVLAGALAACGQETDPAGPRRQPVVAGTASDLEGARAAAVVPTGRIEVTVGAPVGAVAAGEARDAKAHTARAGFTYVPVHWEYDVSAAPWGGLLALDPHEASVSVRVGDHSEQLGSPYSVSGGAIADNPERTFYVPVKGEPSPDTVVVQVDYDGDTQTLDLAKGTSEGQGVELAKLADEQPPSAGCPGDGWATTPTAQVTVTCDISWAGRTPYWPGAGWAPEGEWQVIRVARLQATELAASDGSGRLVVRSATDATTAGGVEPLEPLATAPGQADTLQGTLVFPATPGEPLGVALSLTAAATGAQGPVDTRVSLSRQFG